MPTDEGPLRGAEPLALSVQIYMYNGMRPRPGSTGSSQAKSKWAIPESQTYANHYCVVYIISRCAEQSRFMYDQNLG